MPYTPGLLIAVGVEENKEVESATLQTSGNAAKIKLMPDRTKLAADGQDLSFVTIEVTDEDGNLQPNAENLLQFRIDGPGIIAGIDNANLKDLDPYFGSTRKVWHGRALVVIRSTKKHGDITLSVSSPGLIGTTTKIITFSSVFESN